MYSTASTKNRLRVLLRRLKGRKGNAIVYIAMVLIIFGVIGVVMTSLLTSSVVSTTTPNHFRRALYMTEAGMRYALSELRNTEDWTGRIQELNSTTYTVSAEETFALNIFGPWFQSGSYQSKSNGDVLTLTVPEGDMPSEYTMDTSSPYLSIVNYNYVGTSIPSESSSEIDGFTRIDANTVQFDVRDIFIVNSGELVCLAVNIDQETINQMPINSGDTIYVAEQARHAFPQYDGAIEINRSVYFYEELEHDGANNRVKLINLTGRPESAFGADFDTDDVTTSDYAILSNRNHYIVPTGASENISAGGNMNEAINVADRTEHDVGIPPPDIDADEFTDNISEVETASGFIAVDSGADELNIGGGYTPPATTAFGAGWYDANLSVGGDDDYCQAGACIFGLGIRAFFTLDYSGDGDGLTFSVINSDNNNVGSVGGDIELSELIGYAGDSRLDVPGTTFLDGTGNGLQPPKIATEFDTRTNDETLVYCADANSLNENTRNDPLTANRDAVQYIYWGQTDLTGEVPCRNDDPSYDDNQHNAGESEESWSFTTGSDIFSGPIIGSDGTIYVGSNDFRLYALNPDGINLWNFPTGGPVRSSPNIGADGTIYVGSDDGRVYAINPNGTEKWNFLAGAAISRGRPAIGPGGTIYVAAANATLYALDPDDRLASLPFPTANEWTFNLTDNSDFAPGVDPSTGTIYSDIFGDSLVAINPDGTEKWRFDANSDIDTTPAVAPDGTIYFGSDLEKAVFAVNPVGTEKWRFVTGNEVDCSPTIGSDGTVYVGSDDDNLYALNPDGTLKWAFDTGGDIEDAPAIGADGTVYAGSQDTNRLYAINPDGTLKWFFTSGDQVENSPAVDSINGIVYFGSTDNNFYAVNRYDPPRNIKNKFVTSVRDGSDVKVGGEIVEVTDEDDWLKGDPLKGAWAIRIEIARSITVNVNGNYDYTLSSWVRQCDQLDCSDVTGTFYQDTRAQYDGRAPHIEQVVELTPADHALFNRFLFGFTGATGTGVSQNAIIEKFQLSFIRPGDPVITVDPDWP